jgi:hypothetical protein
LLILLLKSIKIMKRAVICNITQKSFIKKCLVLILLALIISQAKSLNYTRTLIELAPLTPKEWFGQLYTDLVLSQVTQDSQAKAELKKLAEEVKTINDNVNYWNANGLPVDIDAFEKWVNIILGKLEHIVNSISLKDRGKVQNCYDDASKALIAAGRVPNPTKPKKQKLLSFSNSDNVLNSNINERKIYGLKQFTFSTLNGNVIANLTERLGNGDTIYSKLETEPIQTNARKTTKNVAELEGYVLSFKENPMFSTKVENGFLKFVTPVTGTIFTLLFRDNRGNLKGAQEVTMVPKPKNTPVNYYIPKVAQSGCPLSIYGNFDGNPATTKMTIDDSSVEIIAESGLQTVGNIKEDFTGSKLLSITENGEINIKKVNFIAIDLTTDQPTLSKGQTGQFSLTASGIKDLDQPVPIKIVNKDPSKVSMENGDTELNVLIPPSNDNKIVLTFKLTGVSTGKYGIQAYINQPVPDVEDSYFQMQPLNIINDPDVNLGEKPVKPFDIEIGQGNNITKVEVKHPNAAQAQNIDNDTIRVNPQSKDTGFIVVVEYTDPAGKLHHRVYKITTKG